MKRWYFPRTREKHWFPQGKMRSGEWHISGNVTRRVGLSKEGTGWRVDEDSTGSYVLQLRGRTDRIFPLAGPRLEIGAGAESSVHWLEPAAEGFFRFSLGHRSFSKGTTFQLNYQGFHLDEERVALFVCEEAIPINGSKLIMAPHPDDAEIAGFAFYRKFGANTWVITATAGEIGSASVAGESNVERTARARIRVEESISIPLTNGIPEGQIGNLLLADGGMEDLLRGTVSPSFNRQELQLDIREKFGKAWIPEESILDWKQAVLEVRRILDAASPDIVVCPHPTQDTHSDHRATARLLADAFAAGGTMPKLCLLYTVHRKYSELEPFGPRGGPLDPPALVSSENMFGFFSFDVSPEEQELKAHALSGISDFQHVRPATRLRLLAEPFVGSYHPSSFLRRAVRAQEWFELMLPRDFSRLCETCL